MDVSRLYQIVVGIGIRINDQNLRFDSIKKIGSMLQMIDKFPEHQKRIHFNTHFEHIKKFKTSTFDIQFLDLIKNYAN